MSMIDWANLKVGDKIRLIMSRTSFVLTISKRPWPNSNPGGYRFRAIAEGREKCELWHGDCTCCRWEMVSHGR